MAKKEAVEANELPTIEEVQAKLAEVGGEDKLTPDERKVLGRWKSDERSKLMRSRADKLSIDDLAAKLTYTKKEKDRIGIIAQAQVQAIKAMMNMREDFRQLKEYVQGYGNSVGHIRSDGRKQTKMLAALLAERPGWTAAKVKKLIKTAGGEFDLPDEAFKTMEEVADGG